MKILSFILATSILFLAVKSGLDSISFQTEAEQGCCGDQCISIADISYPLEQEQQEQNQDNDCSGKSCNPFQVCSSCILLLVTIPFDYLPKPTISTVLAFSYQSAFSSRYGSEFWQPPKIA